jgi:hypothetical protein
MGRVKLVSKSKKEKRKEIIIRVIVIGLLIIGLGFVYGWFLPARPSVILHIAPNFTEIKGFAYAKHPGSMMCIACVGFRGDVQVFYKDELICDASDSLISLGEVIMPIRCDKNLANYVGKELFVNAIGIVTPAGASSQYSYDQENLTLEFIRR